MTQVTDPASGVTQYGYNGQSALVSVQDPRNLTTTYAVDGLGNLNQQASPDTGTTANTYDAAGNLATQTDAKGQTTTYAYDALNRVTLITFHDGSKQAYAYDQGTNGVGRLSSITETDPANLVTHAIAYGYDQKGRVTSEARTVGGVSYVLSYQYDASGRLAGLTYPSGRSVTYGFDALGRVTQVTTTKDSQSAVVVQNVQYHPFGGAKSWTLGNGQIYSRTVDQDGRIASYTLGSANYSLSFDAASRITGIAQVGNPANANSYGYDALDRLSSAILPASNYGYSYDAVGNRLSKITGANTDTYTYSPTSNRLATLTPFGGPPRSFVFDANGSTTNDGVNSYAYDTRGRMVQSTNSASTVTSYRVNALGQRVRKTNANEDRVFTYDTWGKLVAESDPGGAARREYLYLGDIPVGVLQ
jgi:YD repeat-containing protein